MHVALLISILLPMLIGVSFICVFLKRSKKAHPLKSSLPAILVIGIAATGFGLYKLIEYLLQ